MDILIQNCLSLNSSASIMRMERGCTSSLVSACAFGLLIDVVKFALTGESRPAIHWSLSKVWSGRSGWEEKGKEGMFHQVWGDLLNSMGHHCPALGTSFNKINSRAQRRESKNLPKCGPTPIYNPKTVPTYKSRVGRTNRKQKLAKWQDVFSGFLLLSKLAHFDLQIADCSAFLRVMNSS